MNDVCPCPCSCVYVDSMYARFSSIVVYVHSFNLVSHTFFFFTWKLFGVFISTILCACVCVSVHLFYSSIGNVCCWYNVCACSLVLCRSLPLSPSFSCFFYSVFLGCGSCNIISISSFRSIRIAEPSQRLCCFLFLTLSSSSSWPLSFSALTCLIRSVSSSLTNSHHTIAFEWTRQFGQKSNESHYYRCNILKHFDFNRSYIHIHKRFPNVMGKFCLIVSML